MKYKVIVGIVVLVLISCIFIRIEQQKQEALLLEENQKTIGVSIIGNTHTWPEGVFYYAEREIQLVAEENGWDYKLLVADNTNQQSEQIIELVNDEVDCIILLPMDGVSVKTAVISVQDAGIPLVIFDREVPDIAPTATVKGNNTNIGKMTADMLNGMYPDGTNVLEIMGDTSTVPQQRTDGFNEIIHDNFEIEQVGYTGWNRAGSKALFQEWVESHTEEERDEIQAIFSHDDEITLGILDALDEYKAEGSEYGLDNLEVIIGSAGAKELYKRILEDDTYVLASLTYSPEMIVEAIRIGEKIIKGEDYEEMTIIEPEEVTKKNIEEYYDENALY